MPNHRTKFVSRRDRLEQHLTQENNFDDAVKLALPELWMPMINEDTPIILDMFDLGKPLEKKMDYLATVRDGSTGRLVNGYRGKCDLSGKEIIRKLALAVSTKDGKLIMTGASSGEKYAVSAGEPIVSLYTSLPLSELLDESVIDVKETELFANLKILRTNDARVFFDPRRADDFPFASPVQMYLELITGDKLQKDAADQVRRGILASLGKV